MFSADPACEIGFVEQLEKRGHRGREGHREDYFTTKTQRARSSGNKKFPNPELRVLCVFVVKQFLCVLPPSLCDLPIQVGLPLWAPVVSLHDFVDRHFRLSISRMERDFLSGKISCGENVAVLRGTILDHRD